MPPIAVLWGLTGKKITVDVEPGTTVVAFCRILAERQQLGPETVVKLLSSGSGEPLKDSDVVEATEGGYRVLLQMRPKLHLVKHSSEVATTALLARKMSCTAWHGHIDDETRQLIVMDDCKTHPFNDSLPEEVKCQAEKIQELIEGIFLPGSESDFEGYAFVVDPGVEEDIKVALWEAFGFLDQVRGEVTTLEEQDWKKDFAHGDYDEDDDEEDEGEGGEKDRLQKATAIMKGFGKTFEFNFTDDVVCGPVLCFAQNPEDKLMLGVINCRVWT